MYTGIYYLGIQIVGPYTSECSSAVSGEGSSSCVLFCYHTAVPHEERPNCRNNKQKAIGMSIINTGVILLIHIIVLKLRNYHPLLFYCCISYHTDVYGKKTCMTSRTNVTSTTLICALFSWGGGGVVHDSNDRKKGRPDWLTAVTDWRLISQFCRLSS